MSEIHRQQQIKCRKRNASFNLPLEEINAPKISMQSVSSVNQSSFMNLLVQRRNGQLQNWHNINTTNITWRNTHTNIPTDNNNNNNNNKMYDYTNNNWSHWNSNEKLKEKLGSCTGKTLDRFTTKYSYTWNITHNTESTAVWSLKPERWGSPLVQEKYQEEKACDKRGR